ncbi:hypothetical protein ACS0TY_007725 [Phlomoides rotata]
MPPRKNKKLVNGASKSTSKDVISGRKRLIKGIKAGVDSKSHSEEVVSDKKVTEDHKDDDAKESVPTPKIKKPCTWLKLDRLDPPVGSKSSLESSKQGKEAKLTTPVQSSNDNKRKRNERKEKGEEKGESHPIRNEDMANVRHEETKRDEESEKTLGGLIFMCNAKTKPDCFRYQLMGVPASKKEVVMNIEPGLKIFLYDYDLKLMYGVFEASSPGGMQLEPLAFGGAFPAQVRYIVHKDCLPLPESVFKKAMKDSYNEKTRKFKTELTVKQVKILINLFNPAPRLRPNGRSVAQDPITRPAPPADSLSEESLVQRYLNGSGNSDTRGNTPHRDPFFLTEEEYRNNGLQRGRPVSTPTDLAVREREANSADPYFLSEKEYRMYGLRGPQQVMTNNVVVRQSGSDPYDESTTSLVNRYLGLPPMTMGFQAEVYPVSGRDPHYMNDGERAYASHNLHQQSVFNQRSYSLNASSEPSKFNPGARLHDSTSAPVSNRYSFTGPPLLQRR